MAALHIQTCVHGPWAGVRVNTGEAERDPKVPFALLAVEYKGPSSFGLAALAVAFRGETLS